MLRSCHTLLLSFAAAQIGSAVSAQPAVLHTWISDSGTDSGNLTCYQTAPCKTLGHAIDQTYPGGEVVILDASYNRYSGTIDKSITIRSDQAASTFSGYAVYVITINAGPDDQVTLDGLDLNGFGPAAPPVGAVDTGMAGVRIMRAGGVTIRNCRIHGFTASAGGEGAGVLVSSSKTRIFIENSFLTDNRYGVLISAPAGQAHVKIFNTSVFANSAAGIKVTAGNDVLLSGTRIVASPKALDLSGGGAATSYGDNVITNGDAPAKIPPN